MLLAIGGNKSKAFFFNKFAFLSLVYEWNVSTFVMDEKDKPRFLKLRLTWIG